jgi:hypothetical protein
MNQARLALVSLLLAVTTCWSAEDFKPVTPNHTTLPADQFTEGFKLRRGKLDCLRLALLPMCARENAFLLSRRNHREREAGEHPADVDLEVETRISHGSSR